MNKKKNNFTNDDYQDMLGTNPRFRREADLKLMGYKKSTKRKTV